MINGKYLKQMFLIKKKKIFKVNENFCLLIKKVGSISKSIKFSVIYFDETLYEWKACYLFFLKKMKN